MGRKTSITLLFLLCLGVSLVRGQSLQRLFLNPPSQYKPLMIWQWMDGLVTKEGITRDLEAFKAAGLDGVQNFQIGGEMQGYIGDPACAIGSDRWKEMMLWTMQECRRLGLTFGTHNCPGWSSSASPAVTPEYSMQKVVSSTVRMESKRKDYSLPQPEVDPAYNYYEDIAVLALPNDSTVEPSRVIDLTPWFDKADSRLHLPSTVVRSDAWKAMQGGVIARFGHTTNGKTNYGQAPASGRGLECDKMRREAVKHFWDSYPQKIIDLAGPLAGTTFKLIEIDSYEAGGQTWSVVLPGEFKKRKGYDILPYLPVIAGKWRIADKAGAKKFRDDVVDVVTSLFAENYYGYMALLAERTPGMRLLIEPYGTGGQKPFQVLDMYKILKASPNALVATEFWSEPNWGWRDMARHEKVMRDLGWPVLYAEAFTCWPLRAWKDDPHSLKPLCDKAYCTGVNRMMLHAGAASPWPQAEPGMSFGKWGTQFVPGQTWWKAGGAKAFFDYMARCQALLQQGIPAKKQVGGTAHFKTYLRQVGDTAILFVCNPNDKPYTDTIPLRADGRQVEVWNPYSVSMTNAPAAENGSMPMTIEPDGSRFVIIHPGEAYNNDVVSEENALACEVTDTMGGRNLSIGGRWTVSFPGITTMTTDTLFDWRDSEVEGIRYFSGSATYTTSFRCDKRQLKAMQASGCAWLCLGDVKNLARVKVNGKAFPLMWKAPFGCNVLSALQAGDNRLEIVVTNLWPNRMIGDEHEPDDVEWAEPFRYDYAPGKPIVGSFMKTVPEWLRDGKPRPSQGRKAVYSFKFFTKDSPLLPSGLTGSVTLEWQARGR